MATSGTVASGDLATAKQYNDLRIDVRATHDHDGTEGNSTLKPLVLQFADSVGDPATTGYLQRNGNNLVWYNGTSAIILNATGVLLSGSTNNNVVTVTGSNALVGEAELNFTGTLLYIGSTQSNGGMTTGLTIYQDAGDADELFAFQVAGVGHGMTSLADTDTAMFMREETFSQGGLHIEGLSGAEVGIEFQADITNDDTGKATTANAAFQFDSYKKSGTSAGAHGADANLLAIMESGTTRFIFDAEGSGHADIEFTTFDDKNDIELLRGLHGVLVPGFTESFGKDMEYNLETYEDLGIIGKGSVHVEHREDGRVQLRGMVNMTKLAMLHHSTILQMYDEFSTRLIEVENRKPEPEIPALGQR